jgi:hypothetical protein
MNPMRLLRQSRFLIVFLGLVVFCSIMVIRQYRANQSKHIELREAFILLYTKNYQKESRRLYDRLINDVEKLSNRALLDDFQRTLMLVDPATRQPDNLLWRYHWTVSNELEKRSESTLLRALKLADEQ